MTMENSCSEGEEHPQNCKSEKVVEMEAGEAAEHEKLSVSEDTNSDDNDDGEVVVNESEEPEESNVVPTEGEEEEKKDEQENQSHRDEEEEKVEEEEEKVTTVTPSTAATSELKADATLEKAPKVSNSPCTPPASVQVAVRVRPFLPTESGSTRCVEVASSPQDKKLVQIGGDSGASFAFDEALPESTSQHAVYQACAASLVDACLAGYNATVLAYGQTGSGKTHTILGPSVEYALCRKNSSPTNVDSDSTVSNAASADSKVGIIPRALTDLFQQLHKKQNDAIDATDAPLPIDPTTGKQHVPFDYEVHVQFLELYGDDLRDLLSPSSASLQRQKLMIRDGGPGVEPEVIGATETRVVSAEEALLLLGHGTNRRVTGQTAMNAESSRSHAIMTVVVEQTTTTLAPEAFSSQNSSDASDPSVEVEVKRSKFHFVDLAGSERQKRSLATGQRLKEGIDINRGLLVLGNVISALGDPKKRGTFVPYRDSKLTRLLKGSLGGNHRTLMIACVSPSSLNMDESLGCLRYANRARNIQNNAVVNVDAASKTVAELRGQVQALASELLRVRRTYLEGNVQAEQDVGAFPTEVLSLLASGQGAAASSPPRHTTPRTSMTRARSDVQSSSSSSNSNGSGSGIPPNVLRKRSTSRSQQEETSHVRQVTPSENYPRSSRGNDYRSASIFDQGLSPFMAQLQNEYFQPNNSYNHSFARESSFNDQQETQQNAQQSTDERADNKNGSTEKLTSLQRAVRQSSPRRKAAAHQPSSQRWTGQQSSFYQQQPVQQPSFHPQQQNVEQGSSPSSLQRAVQQAKNYAGAQHSQNYPAAQQFQHYPGAQQSQIYYAAQQPQNYPGAQQFQNYPAAQQFQNYPAAQQPQNYPGAQQLQNYPAAQQPQNYHEVQSSQNYHEDEQSRSYREAQQKEEAKEMEEVRTAVEKFGAQSSDGSAEDNARDEGEHENAREGYYHGRQMELNSKVSELTQNISSKEELMGQLVASQQQYEAMRSFYEDKFREMAVLLKQMEEERDALISDMNRLEKKEQHKEETSKLKQSLRTKEKQIADLKRRQSELSKLKRVSSSNEGLINRLRQDISALKKKRVEFMKEMNMERKAHAKEVMSLRKQAQQRDREVAKWRNESAKKGIQAENAQRVARMRLEEMGRMRSQHREKEQRLRMQALKKNVMAKVGIDGVMLGRRETPPKRGGMHQGYGGAGRNRKSHPMDVNKMRCFLEEKISEVSRTEETAEKMAAEWETHVCLVARREELLKTAKAPQDTEKQKAEVEEQLEAIRVKMKYTEDRIRQLGSSIKPLPTNVGHSGDGFSLQLIFDDKKFKEICGNNSAVASSRAISKVLFGLVVREKRRVTLLARAASVLDQKLVAAEKDIRSKDAAFRESLDEQMRERAEMARQQQEQIMSLVSAVHKTDIEDEAEPDASTEGEDEKSNMTGKKPEDGISAAVSLAMSLSRLKIEALENEIAELSGERRLMEGYKVREEAMKKELTEKMGECVSVRDDLRNTRTILHRMKNLLENQSSLQSSSEHPASGERSVTSFGRESDPSEVLQSLVEQALNLRSAKMSRRSSNDSFTSDISEVTGSLCMDFEDESAAPSWADNILPDLQLIADGEVPPCLLQNIPIFPSRQPSFESDFGSMQGSERHNVSSVADSSQRNRRNKKSGAVAEEDADVFRRLNDPDSFTGIQRASFFSPEQQPMTYTSPAPKSNNDVQGLSQASPSGGFGGNRRNRQRGNRGGGNRNVHKPGQKNHSNNNVHDQHNYQNSNDSHHPRNHNNRNHKYNHDNHNRDNNSRNHHNHPKQNQRNRNNNNNHNNSRNQNRRRRPKNERLEQQQDSSSPGQQRVSDYARRNVFERLQEKLTVSYVGKQNQDQNEKSEHITASREQVA